LSSGSEAEWILDRLSAALERELDTQRRGHRRQPPIRLRDVRKKKKDESSEDAVDAKQDFGND
jgi:potassium channel subfamily K